jgi:putative protease
LKAFFESIRAIRPDALIIADPGVMQWAKDIVPDIPVHLSTQANTTHSGAVRFWESLGAARINLARELSLEEIQKIAHETAIEIEVFVHGSMCISYSGRCLLSSFMADRHSNRGMCCHPCRWNFSVVEETRPGQYFPLDEDSRGSYVFNSKDLCMIGHLPEMIRAGVSSLKIEGRMKSIHFLATVVKTYREALDAYFENPARWKLQQQWIEELSRVSHRPYCTGFYFSDPTQTSPDFSGHRTAGSVQFGGKVTGVLSGKRNEVDVRNRISVDDTVQVITPRGPPVHDRVVSMTSIDGAARNIAHPGTRALIRFRSCYRPNDVVRIVKKSE